MSETKNLHAALKKKPFQLDWTWTRPIILIPILFACAPGDRWAMSLDLASLINLLSLQPMTCFLSLNA